MSELIFTPVTRRFPEAVAVRFTEETATAITQWTGGQLSTDKKTGRLHLDYPIEGRPSPEEKKATASGQGAVIRSTATEGDWLVFSGKFHTVTHEEIQVSWELHPDQAVRTDVGGEAIPPKPPPEPVGWVREEDGPWWPYYDQDWEG